MTTESTSLDRPALIGFAPIFPVADLQRAVEHYAQLGFEVTPYADGAEYAFAVRDGVQLHLSHTPDHDPARGAACVYLYVHDAAALADEWRQAGVGGRTGPSRDTEYGLREAVHVDPDNNMIKFGSRMDG
ncbi:bleomycin resistance protein [Micromonospora okii]|uniref:bleomycin resistance protein n=1 Tax=Micromonospora okii TaxID=1182970 RepID=UPI001E37207F|nr:VOC family protein [Micromonospora okii]